ncbi:hypothetical protein A3D88_01305 [Candidatus Peribacteria bacterium RIFCSPHIGHO2_02_FULL_52_16]|nr:MAG: hypothetical protein A2706_03545 [Candidatus Peribacteria bacterium RIFCSPHIGHO2_01_FULL_51_35]OGJ60959.1 MAG: hypothetical protein A3D88_01305 [Candidatus Peribacteria bacterium RIFCSPHIGHO2_02_FULL_52_16]
MVTIVAFGNFDLEGGRGWALRTGLERHGYVVEFCRTEKPGLFAKYRDLLRQWKSRTGHADLLYVPFLGHYFLPLAWWLARRERIPLTIDTFLSLYDTEVNDRKRFSRSHPYAWMLWTFDWLCGQLADAMLLDTEEHKEYFVRHYGVSPQKILVLPVGCRTDLFVPLHAPPHEGFRVEFHGTFIPLQGIDVILDAARILQERHADDISFELIGRGQTYQAMHDRANRHALSNVTFTGSLPMDMLPAKIANADICLGILGITEKADRVIPNKAYEVLACGKPLLTGDTTAARRVLAHGENAYLSRPGDPEALAAAILRLKADPALREKLAKHGRMLTEKQFLPEKIVEPLVQWLTARS